MRGSRISNPTITATAAVTLVGLLVPVLAVRAADIDQPPALGQPVVLFSPDTPTPASSGLGHSVGSTAPTKRPGTPVRGIPLDGKPLIPPAPAPAPLGAKLGPPPAPRPALSLETDLQPLTTPPTPPAGASNPAAPKAPSS
jgi:hypothetical protein